MQQAPSRLKNTRSVQVLLLLVLCTYSHVAPASALLNVGQHLKAVGEAALGAVDPRLWDVAKPSTSQNVHSNTNHHQAATSQQQDAQSGAPSSSLGDLSNKEAARFAGDVLEEAHQHAMKLVEQAHAALLDLNVPQPQGKPRAPSIRSPFWAAVQLLLILHSYLGCPCR